MSNGNSGRDQPVMSADRIKQIAGDALRGTALKAVEEMKAVAKAAREQVDMLDQVAEELSRAVTEQCDTLATRAEEQIDKNKTAIDACRELLTMIKTAGAYQPSLTLRPSERPEVPQDIQSASTKAVEDALMSARQLGAGEGKER
jgi:hypothetical protein